jgi:hypothetical protein
MQEKSENTSTSASELSSVHCGEPCPYCSGHCRRLNSQHGGERHKCNQNENHEW